MTEVNQGFEAAMRRGREFSASGDWAKALTEYIRAAQIAPTDITARYNLALALFKLNQHDQAMQQFQGIVRNQPQNTEAWQRIAEIQQLTGRTPEAVQTYQRLKEIYKKNEKTREMAEVLREIIRLEPGRTEAYRELTDLLKSRGDRKGAASLVLSLGQYYHTQGQTQDALSAVNEALLLLPGMPEAESLRSQLNGNGNGNGNGLPAANGSINSLEALPPLPDFNGGSNGNSDLVYKAPSAEDTINQLIIEAEQALARGDTGPALRNYELAVETGANRADIFYSIGQLYAENHQPDRAIDYLRRATVDPDYAASAFFSIGQIYTESERLDEAANAYRDALDRIDVQTIGKDEVDELITMYEALDQVLTRQGKENEVIEAYKRLTTFLTEKNLRTEKAGLAHIRYRELNDKLNAPAVSEVPAVEEDDEEFVTSSIRFGTSEDTIVSPDGQENPAIGEVKTGLSATLPPIGSFAGASSGTRPSVVTTAPDIPARFPSHLIEIEAKPDPYVQSYLRAAEDFLRSNRLNAAIDACQEMIRYFPDYLPSQALLAEVYVAQDRLEQARTKYQFIVDLYQLRNDQTKSIDCYKRLAELSPDNAGLRTKLANLLLKSGQKEEAAELMLVNVANYVRTGQLERALEECRTLRGMAPQNASIRVQYAELLIRMDRYNEALPELARALEIDGNNIRALALLNITSFILNDKNLRWSSFQTVVDQGRKEDSKVRIFVEEYRQAAVLHSAGGLQYALGCLYQEAKQPKQALVTFEQTLQQGLVANTDYELLVSWAMGQLYLDQQRAEPAVEALSRVATMAEKADPSNYAPNGAVYGILPTKIQIFRKLSQAFQMQGNPAQAIKALKSVKLLMPYNRELHSELAELYFNQGQLSEALGELGELVTHYEETGKVEAMIEVLKEMAQLAPNNIGVRDKLSEIYLKRGMIDDGLKELDELAELQRKNGRLKDAVRSLQKAAETYWMMGRMEPAYELYDRIVRISPGDVEARQQLVNRHLMAGRVAEAIEEQRTIAQICLQSNNTQEAIAALHQVIGLAPEDTRAYFQLANVLSSTNEHYQAYRLYQRILRLEPNNEKAKALLEQAYKRAVETGQIKPENK